MKKLNNKKNPRDPVFKGVKTGISEFIHIGEIIPGVLREVERRIEEAKSPPLKGEHKREKTSNVKIHIACIPDLRIK